MSKLPDTFCFKYVGDSDTVYTATLENDEYTVTWDVFGKEPSQVTYRAANVAANVESGLWAIQDITKFSLGDYTFSVANSDALNFLKVLEQYTSTAAVMEQAYKAHMEVKEKLDKFTTA